MGKYGLKIKNIEASTLFENNNGVRDHFEYTNAMLTNSLFFDFLIENGLKTWNESSTRDIICLEFNYGSRSYEEEVSHLNKLLEKYKDNEEKSTKIYGLLKFAEDNCDKYEKLSKERIREKFYTEGCDVTYVTRKKNGEVKKTEHIHYKMLFRSVGKAKKGSCMFIRDKLYPKAIKFLRMGIKLPKHKAPIVEISAYSPLVASTIIDKIHIDTKNILVVNDIESYFNTKVINIETTSNKNCIANVVEDYQLKNDIFDGQALIDSSIFPQWGEGYILLRHHFCKMAAFKTHIQKFMQDYYGENYLDAKVYDIWGTEHNASDVLLITTPNAMKWMKSTNIDYNYWCDRVKENGSMFGIVKTAHESKFGDVQRMSYQMINALDMDAMPNVCKKSIEYLEQLKRDDDVYLEYLRKSANFSNDHSVLVALVEQNRDFLRSQYFRDRKKKIIEGYLKNLKEGHIIQNADNLVIVGSPYAMLISSVGEDISNDNTFCQENGTIQCYTERFPNDTYLATFRSPFNSKNNMGYVHNVYSQPMQEYFDFGKQIIAVNMIGTDWQDRNNGADQDSDTVYTTDQPDIVACAKRYYIEYPTVVNNIPKDKNVYDNTLLDFARMDNALAAAQLAIGESSNLAQICQTYSYNYPDQKYKDYACILAVLAQVAIDNAKRRFDIDLNAEIRRIKRDMGIGENQYPAFWGLVKEDFNKRNINHNLTCPMNYVGNIKVGKFRDSTPTLPMSYFFEKYPYERSKQRSCRKVEELISRYSLRVREEFDDDGYLLLREDFDNLVHELSLIYLSKNYLGFVSWLLDRAFVITPSMEAKELDINCNTSKNKSILIKTLYDINPTLFLKCWSKNM